MDFFISKKNSYDKNTLKQAEIRIKYEGYIKRQLSEIKKLENLEKYYLPQDLDYFNIIGLTYEAQEKLTKIKPNTLGSGFKDCRNIACGYINTHVKSKRQIKEGI